eukprot:15454371-Alexandrium_andersonii.AAC.1
MNPAEQSPSDHSFGCGGKVPVTALAAGEARLDVLAIQEGRFRTQGWFTSAGFEILAAPSTRGNRG